MSLSSHTNLTIGKFKNVIFFKYARGLGIDRLFWLERFRITSLKNYVSFLKFQKYISISLLNIKHITMWKKGVIMLEWYNPWRSLFLTWSRIMCAPLYILPRDELTLRQKFLLTHIVIKNLLYLSLKNYRIRIKNPESGKKICILFFGFIILILCLFFSENYLTRSDLRAY